MGHTRIILTQLPPMLADLIGQLLDDGTEVRAAASTSGAELIEEASQTRADVVITSDDVTTAEQMRLSASLPGVVVIFIDARGRSGARYVDGRLEIGSEDLSPDILRELLR